MTRRKRDYDGPWIDEARHIDMELWADLTASLTDSWVEQMFVQPEIPKESELTKDLVRTGTWIIGPDGKRIAPEDYFETLPTSASKSGDIGRN